MAHDRSWRTITIASALGIALPITALAVAGASSATVASVPAGVDAAVPMASVLPRRPRARSRARCRPPSAPARFPARCPPPSAPARSRARCRRPSAQRRSQRSTRPPAARRTRSPSRPGGARTTSCVRANRARNNIMESCRISGRTPTTPVTSLSRPARRTRPRRAGCTPLDRLELPARQRHRRRHAGNEPVQGPGPRTRGDDGSSTPELSEIGNTFTPSRSIAGAVHPDAHRRPGQGRQLPQAVGAGRHRRASPSDPSRPVRLRLAAVRQRQLQRRQRRVHQLRATNSVTSSATRTWSSRRRRPESSSSGRLCRTSPPPASPSPSAATSPSTRAAPSP